MHSSLTMRPERARAAVRRTAIVAATATLLLGALVPTVAAADGLSVTTAYPAVAVAPGAKASFDLKVTSTVQGNVALTVSGVPTGWTATLHGGGFVVDGVLAGPGIDATVRLDVQVPGDAQQANQALTVQAKQGGRSDILPISIRVNSNAAGDITVTTNTPSLTGPIERLVPVRADAPQRHRAGRHRHRERGRDRPSRLGREDRDRRRDAGGLDGRDRRRHREHQRHRDAAGERARRAITRSTSR